MAQDTPGADCRSPGDFLDTTALSGIAAPCRSPASIWAPAYLPYTERSAPPRSLSIIPAVHHFRNRQEAGAHVEWRRRGRIGKERVPKRRQPRSVNLRHTCPVCVRRGRSSRFGGRRTTVRAGMTKSAAGGSEEEGDVPRGNAARVKPARERGAASSPARKHWASGSLWDRSAARITRDEGCRRRNGVERGNGGLILSTAPRRRSGIVHLLLHRMPSRQATVTTRQTLSPPPLPRFPNPAGLPHPRLHRVVLLRGEATSCSRSARASIACTANLALCQD